MKRKFTFLMAIIVVLITPLVGYATNTYSGIEISGEKGIDWEFNGDKNHGTILIKNSGISLSGKATSDVDIVIGNGVTDIKLDGVDQGNNSIYIEADKEKYTADKFTVKVSGENTIEHIDIFACDDNGTIENKSDDSWNQADPLTIAGNDKSKDILNVKSDLIGGEKGLIINGVTVVIDAATDKSGETVEMGLHSQGPVDITNSKVNVSWGIFAAGTINIKDSEILTDKGIAANYITYDEATGESTEQYYDVFVENSTVKSNNGVIGNNISFGGNSKIDIKEQIDSNDEGSVTADSIYAEGKLTFALDQYGAYVSAISENSNGWAVNAKTEIIFAGDNGIKNGGNIIYVQESSYGLNAFTLENNSEKIITDLKVVYDKGIVQPRRVERFWGQTQYDTSYAIANSMKEQMGVDKFESVIIATGRDYPDALSGGALAKKVNAPILLVDGKDSANIAVLKEYIYDNLKIGGNIYILGGYKVVPTSIEPALKDYNVRRLGGETLYDTNLLILNELNITNEDILVCTANGYADGLSSAPTGLPVLLVNKDLTSKQHSFLSMLNGNDIYIIGEFKAVNYKIADELKRYGNTKRIGGLTLYDTSALVAEEFYSNAKFAVIACGKDFPDALCGGPFASMNNAPLVLTDDGNIKRATKYIEENGINQGVALGGYKVLKDTTVMNVFGMSSRELIISKEYK